ncbi:ubiquitin carboxyl-terminal hydrolase 22 isoform X1 [Selaginella moellendorffii]|uniref:ubiquitin carboxyl-terminal hydrolase 22 isoform X1 n=1 Tax=Selaginella moellendorffii TaxID=88036 RepID=UPI000D1CF305|nr:ubiquitin carboxyl-terminal hydrolase 22 isoform X1 [Selaginella moellendorffii]|eukprot:XP_024534516.1 ubiquitin carboxyl-terminal hydrolase 22 isoform X1 [Selaginella moellendorffii]
MVTKSSSPCYRPCEHLVDYKSKHSTRGFRALQRCIVVLPPGRPSVRTLSCDEDPVPRCASCAKSHGRLYACLICSTISCYSSSSSHARSHALELPGHELAIDLDRAELFCCICNDQVYDADFDWVVVCAQSGKKHSVVSSGSGNAGGGGDGCGGDSGNGASLLAKHTSFSNGRTSGNAGGGGGDRIDGGKSASSLAKCTSFSNGRTAPPLNVYSRKRNRGAEYKPWEPSSKDPLVLERGAAPLGLRGLTNMGSTCFMNSVLQALLHTPPLRSYFLGHCHNKAACQSKVCLGCDMDDMFAAAFSGDRTPYSPAQFLYRRVKELFSSFSFPSHEKYLFLFSFLNSWWQHAANLAGYEQQDAHDFFISAVEGIHANSQQPELRKGNDAECRCIVHRVFSGLLRSDVTCTACGFTSTKNDPCVDISLDLESTALEKQIYASSSTLLGCLDRFTRPERLGSNERFFCESCQSRQEAVKQMSVRKLPVVLCFHVKRFEHSAKNYRKVDTYVQFPLSLNMACYLSSSIARLRHGNRLIFVEGKGELGGDNDSGSTSPSSEFELFAVVSHSGKLDGGHYVAYLRLGGEWYKCDDAWITRVGESVVRATQAYMLYYVQRSLSDESSTTIPERFNQHQTLVLDEKIGYTSLLADAVQA